MILYKRKISRLQKKKFNKYVEILKMRFFQKIDNNYGHNKTLKHKIIKFFADLLDKFHNIITKIKWIGLSFYYQAGK